MLDKKRLPHAILLRGQSGIGKLAFAISLSQALLCEKINSANQACGVCPSCGWFEQDNHPDFRLISPEQDVSKDDEVGTKNTKKRTQIVIEQIRGLSDFLSLSSHKSDGVRIVLIHPAEGLNAAAANALLKMLEEPPPNVIFILVAHQAHKILPTIMSRCQKIDMPVPSSDDALVWMRQEGIQSAEVLLSYVGGSPLMAIDEEEEGVLASIQICKLLSFGAKSDVFQLSTACLALGMENAVSALQKWSYDLLLCHFTQEVRYHPSQESVVKKLAQQLHVSQLLDFQKMLGDAKKSANHPLNNELQLERLFLHYIQIFK
ncbi:MAG: DNA polymerase III subunit delta' [Candidatus Methylopumilus sp.]|nr:DNA polymerase III subunit delta' [Candidatus Methylopumilus sp.]